MADVGLRVTLAFARGPAITRTWTWQELKTGRIPEWLHGDPPTWLRAAEITIERDPVVISCSANVPEGLEEQARRLLDQLPLKG